MTPYLSEFLVFIGSPVLFLPLFQRLGFGSVLGYLIAGIIVGPFGMQLVTGSENISKLSEFGVVFLLFLIGLDIQPRKLWSMRRHLLGLGGLQVLACTLVFSAFGVYAGWTPVAAGLTGFALSLSSTAFAVQSLIEKNVFNTEYGRASFSVLLTQDLVAIPALAVIPSLARGHADASHASPNVWLALLIVAGLVTVSRFLIRPIFRMIASMRSRDLFTAATLLIVLGVAELMELAGLSAALGTFIAGVLLADSEYRHELEANLEPFKSLLMGLFFIAVGMGVDLRLVIEKPLLVLALTVSYSLIKAGIIYFVARIFKLKHQNSKLTALTIAQGGEFAFVIFAMIAQLKLVPSESLALLTVVIAASMALSPLLNLADERLSSLLRRKPAPGYDEIKDESPEVIIAGFGRVGQIFGRVLRSQGIPFVAIDHDANQIDLVRRFGNKVYYGDVSRADILEAAGAARAKYFILAVDDVEVSLKTAEIIRNRFPKLKIYARARNRSHVFDLMELGIEKIKRETFGSSVEFVKDLLLDMGFPAERTRRLIERFRAHDEILMKKQFLVHKDERSFISVSQQGVEQLAQILSEESLQSHIQ
jgi:monovalent cation:proton antiporter-2 (CPA2) family protein